MKIGKTQICSLCGMVLVLVFAPLHASGVEDSDAGLVHLELDMSSEEYRALVEPILADKADDPLKIILDAGKRNLDWLDVINGPRQVGQRLELSTAATQTGTPIELPGTSNREIVLRQWNDELAVLPTSMKDVLVGTTPGGATPAVGDVEFLDHARKVDKIYQRASRWLLQEPNLLGYAARSYMDIRGFYALGHEVDLEGKLRGWPTLSESERTRLGGYMVGLCANSRATAASCKTRLDAAVNRDGNAWNFYSQNRAAGQAMWDSYFKIPMTRRDITWTSANPEELRIPFHDPGRADVTDWLRDNIQDEWRWLNWQLFLDFQPTGDDSMTHVVFEAGATPHVNGIAGSEITMDGNRALGEYSSRWTIRHEYGHVLGFPDCYVEFYDQPAGVMVNYQLDVTNLMCSRKGKLQEKHFLELQRAYFH